MWGYFVSIRTTQIILKDRQEWADLVALNQAFRLIWKGARGPPLVINIQGTNEPGAVRDAYNLLAQPG